MTKGYGFDFRGEQLIARPSGALYWPARETLVVSDLHLGKSQRYARLGRALLPPYETADTLRRLAFELAEVAPRRVIALGDSFDDAAAATEIACAERATIRSLTSERDWIWVTGNHDAGLRSEDLGGSLVDEIKDGLTFRHIRGETPDVSGHYHPVLPFNGRRWRCFLHTPEHLVLPAFGTYTGGLDLRDTAFDGWARSGQALLCGRKVFAVPL